MTISEKVAYLKGIAAGMSIEDREDGDLLIAIIDTLSEMADEIEDLGENALDIGDEIDALSDDLADVENIVYDGEFDFFDEDDFDFDVYDFDDDDFDDVEDYDEDEQFGCELCGKHGVSFTVDINCPECDTVLELDEEDVENESVTCPVCDKLIELEIEEVDFEYEDGDEADHPEDEASNSESGENHA